jgi:hypothetical protein
MTETSDEPENLVLRELRKLRAEMLDRFAAIEAKLDDIRTELDGQFQMMTSRNSGWEALARLVAEQGKRITALERSDR